jgi:hypothetical protein
MPVAALTAAVQEPDLPRAAFRSDPLGSATHATLAWLEGAAGICLSGIQLGAALAVPDAYVPAEQMLDPVAAHLPIRTFRDGGGQDLTTTTARAIVEKANDNGISIFDLGFFENLLHPDTAIRAQIHQHLLRTMRASVMLREAGCRGVTTFIGRDMRLDIHQNLLRFEEFVIPLLHEFRQTGSKLWVENCPMPGWSPSDSFVQNIAYCPFMWVLMSRIAKKYGVDGVLRFTYDESHDILLGSTHRGSFEFLRQAGYAHLIDRVHGKSQNRNLGKIAAHGMLGQRAALGIHNPDGSLVHDPALLGKAWGRMTAAHTLPGFSDYSPWAITMGHTVDWLDHQLALRQILGLDVSQSVFIIEHEQQGGLRVQDMKLVLEALEISADFVDGCDGAADAMHRARLWSHSNNIEWMPHIDPNKDFPGITEEVEKVLAFEV